MKLLIPLEDVVPGYAAENTGPVTEGAMTVNQPLLCVTMDHAASILVIPVAQDHRGAQRPTPRRLSVSSICRSCWDAEWGGALVSLTARAGSGCLGQGGLTGAVGAMGVSGHCVVGKSNGWAETEDGESTRTGRGRGDRRGLTRRRPGFHSRGGGAGWSGSTFSSYTWGSGFQAPLDSGWTAGPAGGHAAKLLDLTDALIHHLRVKKLPGGCEGLWWKQAPGTLRGFLLGSLRLFPQGNQGVPGSDPCTDRLAPQSGVDKKHPSQEAYCNSNNKNGSFPLYSGLSKLSYNLTASGKIKNKGTIAREQLFCGVNHPRPPWGVDKVRWGLSSANFLASCPVAQVSCVSGVAITCLVSRTYQGCIFL